MNKIVSCGSWRLIFPRKHDTLTFLFVYLCPRRGKHMPYMLSVNIFASWSHWFVSERLTVDKIHGMRSYKRSLFNDWKPRGWGTEVETEGNMLHFTVWIWRALHAFGDKINVSLILRLWYMLGVVIGTLHVLFNLISLSHTWNRQNYSLCSDEKMVAYLRIFPRSQGKIILDFYNVSQECISSALNIHVNFCI